MVKDLREKTQESVPRDAVRERLARVLAQVR